jgi:ABC-type proline/glycine betaine transport system permease subunit
VGTDLTIGGVAVAGLLTVVVALVMNRIIRRFEERAAAAFPDPPLIRPCG